MYLRGRGITGVERQERLVRWLRCRGITGVERQERLVSWPRCRACVRVRVRVRVRQRQQVRAGARVCVVAPCLRHDGHHMVQHGKVASPRPHGLALRVERRVERVCDRRHGLRFAVRGSRFTGVFFAAAKGVGREAWQGQRKRMGARKRRKPGARPWLSRIDVKMVNGWVAVVVRWW